MDIKDLGRVPSEPGSREPSPDGLGPSGFDPSRYGSWACSELMTIKEAGGVNHAMHDRWVAQSKQPAPLPRNDSGWADLAAIAILYLRHVRDSDRHPEGGDGEAGSGSEASRARA